MPNNAELDGIARNSAENIFLATKLKQWEGKGGDSFSILQGIILLAPNIMDQKLGHTDCYGIDKKTRNTLTKYKIKTKKKPKKKPENSTCEWKK